LCLIPVGSDHESHGQEHGRHSGGHRENSPRVHQVHEGAALAVGDLLPARLH